MFPKVCSVNSSARKTVSHARIWHHQKFSRDMDTASSSRFSKDTEGLILFCSISEMVPLLTSAICASFLWEKPLFFRAALSEFLHPLRHLWFEFVIKG